MCAPVQAPVLPCMQGLCSCRPLILPLHQGPPHLRVGACALGAAHCTPFPGAPAPGGLFWLIVFCSEAPLPHWGDEALRSALGRVPPSVSLPRSWQDGGAMEHPGSGSGFHSEDTSVSLKRVAPDLHSPSRKQRTSAAFLLLVEKHSFMRGPTSKGRGC